MTSPCFIARAMQPVLHSMASIFPVVTICGPRQSGKTTLCRMEFPSLPYVNLEDLSTRELAESDPKGFLHQYGEGAIIDEVQLVPALFSQIQVLVDEDRFNGNPNRRFIITGSRNFALAPELRQTLAGRTGLLTLMPLSTAELAAAGHNPSFEESILYGGYPAVWTNSREYWRMIVDNYINTYVERDVRRLMDVKDLRKFSIFLRLCAARIGSELNKSSLAVEAGVSAPTVDSWLSVLEASYVIQLLQPWHANIGKRLVKTPKLYFSDTAVACSLLSIEHCSQLAGHPMRGALFENVVVNNMVKYELNRGRNASLYYYRDKTGREIDIIRETSGGLQAFEIKAGMTFNPDFFRHINYFRELMGDRLAESAVVYAGDSETRSRENGVVCYTSFPEQFMEWN